MNNLNNICEKLHMTYNTTYINKLKSNEIKFFKKVASELTNTSTGNTTLLNLIRNLNSNVPVAKFISGPKSLSKHTKGEKIFYIFGENHKGVLCKENFITITDYLKELLINTPVFIDIYIELSKEYNDNYLMYEKLDNSIETSNIPFMINEFTKCYKDLSTDEVCKNSRIHFTDIRNKSIFFEIGMIQFYQKRLKNNFALDIFNEIKNVFIPFLNTYSTSDDTETRVEETYIMFLDNPLFFKELSRSIMKEELEIYTKERIREYVNQYLHTDYLSKEKFKEALDSFNSVQNGRLLEFPSFVSFFFDSLNVIIMDIYLLARIFKRFKVPSDTYQPIEPHNIIIYAGDYHCNRYRTFLEQNDYITEFLKVNEVIRNSCIDISEIHQPLFRNTEIVMKIDWRVLSGNPNAINLLEQNQDKIDWSRLSQNPNAIDLLEANQDKIDWRKLSRNPNAIHLLEANQDKIHWKWLSTNPNAIHLLEANQDKLSRISWLGLSSNPNAINLLEANQDKIHWKVLSHNPNAIRLLEQNKGKIYWMGLLYNPNAIRLLEQNQDKIYWGVLSQNPNAIHLLEANQDKIDWTELSGNPKAIHLLEANQDKIDWERLSGNPNAIHLLEANQDKISWWRLSYNPNAIHLLKANQDKIDWIELSGNPNVIQFIDNIF